MKPFFIERAVNADVREGVHERPGDGAGLRAFVAGEPLLQHPVRGEPRFHELIKPAGIKKARARGFDRRRRTKGTTW
jgi:hypothetical protein